MKCLTTVTCRKYINNFSACKNLNMNKHFIPFMSELYKCTLLSLNLIRTIVKNRNRMANKVDPE